MNISDAFERISDTVYDDIEYCVNSDNGVMITMNLDDILRSMKDLCSIPQPKSKSESVTIYEASKPI